MNEREIWRDDIYKYLQIYIFLGRGTAVYVRLGHALLVSGARAYRLLRSAAGKAGATCTVALAAQRVNGNQMACRLPPAPALSCPFLSCPLLPHEPETAWELCQHVLDLVTELAAAGCSSAALQLALRNEKPH